MAENNDDLFFAIPADEMHLEDYEHISKNSGNRTFERTLIQDEDTGMMVRLITYPKGSVTPEHDHNCAHGMYVLKGTLHTDRGDFGPGSFVWFKEGCVAEHGGLDEDVTVVFITNKPFNINYHNLPKKD
jgi:anti-sigma factor ChrR (cupin superfamily)